jgi:hypothetical protein
MRQEDRNVEFGGALGIVLLVGIVVIIAVFAGRSLFGNRESAIAPAPPEPRREIPSNRLSARLSTLHRGGRHQDVIRLLDQSLPEWIVAGTLVETARELTQLDAAITQARGLGVTEEVTRRLSEQSAGVATDLWELAERMVIAEQTGSRELRAELEAQDASLLRLTDGMREARDELARLSLPGDASTDIDRAERRFRSLAATARELHEWEREQ